MFLHGNLAHLASNVFVLHSVGREVERDVGSLRFVLVYLASGVSAGLIYMAVNPASDVPVIGASGAIFGLIAVMLLLMPFKVTTALLLPLPGVVMGLLLVLVEIAAVVERLRPLSDPAAWGVVCYSSSRKELSSPWNPDQDTSLASSGCIAGSEQT